MKKALLAVIAFFAITCTHAQELKNNLYYYKGKQVPLSINYKTFYIAASSNVNLNTVFGNYGYTIDSVYGGTVTDSGYATQYWKVVRINNANPTLSGYNTLRSNLKNNDNLIVGASVGTDTPTTELSHYFYVKLKDADDEGILEDYASSTHTILLGHLSEMPLWYKLKVDENSDGNSLEMSNYFYETGAFADIDPGFILHFKLASCSGINDPYHGSQWGLDKTNTTLTPPVYGINACDAWSNSTYGTLGDASIKVAIVDAGIPVDIDHSMGRGLEYPENIDYYDAKTGIHNPTPQQVVFNGDHGEYTSSIIIAPHNNIYQGNYVGMAGIAPNSSLMNVVHDMQYQNDINSGANIGNGISWAVNNGADIFNCSWGAQNQSTSVNLPSPILDDALFNAMNNGRNGKGCVVVFCAGNDGNSMDYPQNVSSLSQMLTVGSIKSDGMRDAGKSSYGPELDIVAPGHDVLVGSVANIFGYESGTSYAAPQAAGVAALILAKNPNLSGDDVRTIIENTTQKIRANNPYVYSRTPQRPCGSWTEELGYGLLDAGAALELATTPSLNKPNKDLYIKDNVGDLGEEPNPATRSGSYFWLSEDIWIRNNSDGLTTHQSPVYNPSGSNNVTVYVRVRNKGGAPSLGNETLELYWSKASTSLTWTGDWTSTSGSPQLGGSIATIPIPIPVIQPGCEVILSHSWTLPNPANYVGLTGRFSGVAAWHFCLLGRITPDGTDPLYSLSGSNIFVPWNNNIAMKNITIMSYGGAFAVGIAPPPLPHSPLVRLKLSSSASEALYNKAEVSFSLDSPTWAKWQAGGALGSGFRIKKNAVRTLLATGPDIVLQNLTLDNAQTYLTAVQVNFLTEAPATTQTEFNLDLIETDSTGDTIIGGERFIVEKPERSDMFSADASYTEPSGSDGTTFVLHSTTFSEPVTYKWYTADTTFVDSGANITVHPTATTNYILEVTSNTDGYKDYDNVLVTVSPNYITSISPNPASGSVTVGYHVINTVSTAQIRITNISNPSIYQTYSINKSLNSATLNIGGLPTGNYTVRLICDNILADTEQLIKN